MDSIKPTIIVGIGLFVLISLVAGCASAAKRAKGNDSQNLTLFAFNYTDRYMMNITVDGVWMGGASAFKLGGDAMGPLPPRNRRKPHRVEVRWEVSGRYEMRTNTYTRMPVERKSASVPIKFPYPDHPDTLLLHFYPDGHVEAEMLDRRDDKFNFRRIPIPKGHKDYGRS